MKAVLLLYERNMRAMRELSKNANLKAKATGSRGLFKLELVWYVEEINWKRSTLVCCRLIWLQPRLSPQPPLLTFLSACLLSV